MTENLLQDPERGPLAPNSGGIGLREEPEEEKSFLLPHGLSSAGWTLTDKLHDSSTLSAALGQEALDGDALMLDMDRAQAVAAQEAGTVTISFAPLRARCLRIINTGTALGLYWSVNELTMFGPAR